MQTMLASFVANIYPHKSSERRPPNALRTLAERCASSDDAPFHRSSGHAHGAFTTPALRPQGPSGLGNFVTSTESFRKSLGREVTACGGTFPCSATLLLGFRTRIRLFRFRRQDAQALRAHAFVRFGSSLRLRGQNPRRKYLLFGIKANGRRQAPAHRRFMLPARLLHARDQALRSHLAELNTADAEQTDVALRTSRDLATVVLRMGFELRGSFDRAIHASS